MITKKINKDFYASLSQQEIADIAHFVKLKTNKILNELIDVGCVYIYHDKRGKYELTDKDYKILNVMRKTNTE